MGSLDKKLIIGIAAISAITALLVFVAGRVVETQVVDPMIAKMKEKKAEQEPE